MESVLWGTTARYVIKPQVGNPLAGRNKRAHQTQALNNPFAKKRGFGRSLSIAKKSMLGEDVVLLVNNLNDKAYLYNSGKIDIIKNGNIVIRKFPNMKDASLYLLKAGWQYVR
jgi:hypothetical protein